MTQPSLQADRRNEAAIERRQAMMAIAARATASELSAVLSRVAPDMESEDLRRVETGLVMVRGRIGGEGNAFNLGEATVTRAAVRIASGETGFAYHLGRDSKKARMAAVVDALLQCPPHAAAVEEALGEIERRIADDDARHARQMAATRVNFFTMVRGEDKR